MFKLSSRSDDCWSSHIVSAMTGLVQKYTFKSCGTVNPLTSVVLLWTSKRDPWSFGHPTLMAAHESTTAKFTLITDGVHSPPKRLCWLLVLPTAFPSTCSLPSHKMSFAVLPVSGCVSTHTLRFETATWNPGSSPTCDLCEADDVQDEQHAIFYCTPPHSVSTQEI